MITWQVPKKVPEVTRIIRRGVRRKLIVYVQWGAFRAPLLGAYLRNPHTYFGDKLRLYLKFGKTKFAVNNAIRCESTEEERAEVFSR